MREGERDGVAEEVVREQVEREVVAQEERVARDLAAEPLGVGIAVAQPEERPRHRPVHQPRRDDALVPRDALRSPALRDRLCVEPGVCQREEAVAEARARRVARCASGEVDRVAELVQVRLPEQRLHQIGAIPRRRGPPRSRVSPRKREAAGERVARDARRRAPRSRRSACWRATAARPA